LSGTSMATPLVSGVAALVWSLRPDLSYRQVKDVLIRSVDKIASFGGKVYSGGRINAYKALQLAKTLVAGKEVDSSPYIPGLSDTCLR
jgi:subtilisin family serine protease